MSDIVPLDNLSNDDLKKWLASQIALEDWTDECSKYGYPQLLHKDHVLHHDATCNRGMEVPNILRENWKAYTIDAIYPSSEDEGLDESMDFDTIGEWGSL